MQPKSNQKIQYSPAQGVRTRTQYIYISHPILSVFFIYRDDILSAPRAKELVH